MRIPTFPYTLITKLATLAAVITVHQPCSRRQTEEMASNISQGCLVFDNKTFKTVGMVRIAASSFSILISTLVLVFLCAKQTWKRGHGQRLLLYFTITVVFEGPSCIMQSAAINYDKLTVNRPLCIAAGIYNQYSNWLVNLTILWIAFYLFRVYIINVFHSSSGRTRLRMRSRTIGAIILVLILVVPIPLALIPLWGRKYGVVDAWCWIIALNQNDCTKDTLGIIYQYTLAFVPFLLEVIVLTLLSIAIFLTFLRGYTTYRQHPVVQREYYHRMQEFLPLLLSLFIYSLLCTFQVANFTTDLLNRPRPIMWIVDIITGHVKEVVVMAGYLATLQVIVYRVKKRNKEMGLASVFRGKDYSTFEVLTPNQEETDQLLCDKEEAT